MNAQKIRTWRTAQILAAYDIAIFLVVGVISALSGRLNAVDYGTDLITTCFILITIGLLSMASGWCTSATLWTQLSPPLTYKGVLQDGQAFLQSQTENYRLCVWNIAASVVPLATGLLLRTAGA